MKYSINILFFVLVFAKTCFGQIHLASVSDNIVFHSEFEKRNYTESGQALSRLLMHDPDIDTKDVSHIETLLDEHISFLSSKSKNKSSKSLVKSVFNLTHRKFLKHYQGFSLFSDIFLDKGSYDCVTGTALLAFIYQRLGFETKIRETAFHMYLMVEKDNDVFLIESTDPIGGFVSDPRRIVERMKEYGSSTSIEGSYEFKQLIHNSIDLEHLVGLQYYNQAIQYYNDGKHGIAYIHIVKAADLYSSSKRIEEIKKLISARLSENELIANLSDQY